MGSMGSMESINFEKGVLEPINFSEAISRSSIFYEICYLVFDLFCTSNLLHTENRWKCFWQMLQMNSQLKMIEGQKILEPIN